MGALLRAFAKTLAERHHSMVILDAPNSRAAELREFWQAGQKAGYEVYGLGPLETDAEVRSCTSSILHASVIDCDLSRDCLLGVRQQTCSTANQR